MRKKVRIAVIVLAVGFSAAPLLYGLRLASGSPNLSIQSSSIAASIVTLSERIKSSDPALLLVFGIGLIVSAGRLPRMFRSKQACQTAAEEKANQGGRERVHARPAAVLNFEPAAHKPESWSRPGEASNGTLG